MIGSHRLRRNCSYRAVSLRQQAPRPHSLFLEQTSVRRPIYILLFGLACIVLLGRGSARADSCPSAQDDIATDRPDVTNSSIVVPVGSLQNENGNSVCSLNMSATIRKAAARANSGIRAPFITSTDCSRSTFTSSTVSATAHRAILSASAIPSASTGCSDRLNHR